MKIECWVSFLQVRVIKDDASTNFHLHFYLLGTGTRTGKHAVSLPSEEVKLAQRPVTAAGGLGGLKKHNDANSFHQKRQIQDASYFLSLLQTKEKAITSEIKKMNDELQRLQVQNGKQSMEAIHQDLLKEVRELEGLLADHNVAHDKMRRGCDPEELESRQIELQMNNDRLASDLDEIFVSKQQCERNIATTEQDIERLHKSVKNRFQNTDPAIYSEYQENMKQINALYSEGKVIEKELDEMRMKLQKLLSLASNNENYQRQKLYAKEEEKVTKLRSNIVDIDADIFVAQMKPEDAHRHLLNEVKSYQARLNELTTQEKRLIDEIEQERNKQVNIQNQANEVELDNIIKLTKETVSKLWLDNKKKQQDIFDILGYLNKHSETYVSAKPTQEGLQQLSEDIDFRTKHLTNSEQTMKRLLDQKEKRLREVSLSLIS